MIYTVYRIVNCYNGWVYYGQSKQWETRVRGHKSALKTNSHDTPKLQKDYNDGHRMTYEKLSAFETRNEALTEEHKLINSVSNVYNRNKTLQTSEETAPRKMTPSEFEGIRVLDLSQLAEYLGKATKNLSQSKLWQECAKEYPIYVIIDDGFHLRHHEFRVDITQPKIVALRKKFLRKMAATN